MTLKNTSELPTVQVRKLVRLGLEEIDSRDLHVYVSPERDGGGHGYSGYAGDMTIHSEPIRGSGWHEGRPRKRFFIRCRLGRWPTDRPHTTYHARSPEQRAFRKWIRDVWEPGMDYPEFVGRWPVLRHRDWRECLVSIAAHEGEHVHQFQHGVQLSEIRCEMAAARALRRYRERGGADGLLLPGEPAVSYT